MPPQTLETSIVAAVHLVLIVAINNLELSDGIVQQRLQPRGRLGAARSESGSPSQDARTITGTMRRSLSTVESAGDRDCGIPVQLNRWNFQDIKGFCYFNRTSPVDTRRMRSIVRWRKLKQ